MPLSKERMRERKRRDRLAVKPNRSLLAHITAYPDGFNPDGSYRKDYNPELDVYINPIARVKPNPLPNSPDGRYHPKNVKPSVIPNLDADGEPIPDYF